MVVFDLTPINNQGMCFRASFFQAGNLCRLSWTSAAALRLWSRGVRSRWRRTWEEQKQPQSSACIPKKGWEERKVSSFKTHLTWFCFLDPCVMLRLLLFQECWRPTSSRARFCPSAAPRQSRPPPPSSSTQWSSSCTGSRGSGMTSSHWLDRATSLGARTVAAGRSGEIQRLQSQEDKAVVSQRFLTFYFFLPQGSHVGLWHWKLRNLPSVLAGGTLLTAAVEWRSVRSVPIKE